MVQQIIWSIEAEDNLLEIKQYIARNSLLYAEKTIRGIVAKLKRFFLILNRERQLLQQATFIIRDCYINHIVSFIFIRKLLFTSSLFFIRPARYLIISIIICLSDYAQPQTTALY
jgi:hypothetical protein